MILYVREVLQTKIQPTTIGHKVDDRYFEHNRSWYMKNTSQNTIVNENIANKAKGNTEQKVNDNGHNDVKDENGSQKMKKYCNCWIALTQRIRMFFTH